MIKTRLEANLPFFFAMKFKVTGWSNLKFWENNIEQINSEQCYTLENNCFALIVCCVLGRLTIII